LLKVKVSDGSWDAFFKFGNRAMAEEPE